MTARDLSLPPDELAFVVAQRDCGQRLDRWLHHHLPWHSRNQIQQRIHEGRVLLDGAVARKGRKVNEGQTVRLLLRGEEGQREAAQEAPSLTILHEDETLVALDKAPHTLVHPVGRHVTDTLINALHARFQQEGGGPEQVPPMIVHRLDRETSGVLVLAKTLAARKQLGREFEGRRVLKSYLALVKGCPKEERGVVERPIGPHPSSAIRLKMACTSGGKPSCTAYRVLARSTRMSLLRCWPKTGRQHQIRVHLAALGHPVLCDRLYGKAGPMTGESLGLKGPEARRILLDRQALHAERILFRHPSKPETIDLISPLAADLHTLLRLAPDLFVLQPTEMEWGALPWDGGNS